MDSCIPGARRKVAAIKAVSVTLTDEQIINTDTSFFPVWSASWLGKRNEIVQDAGKLWRSLHDITNAAQNTKPSSTPSMWAEVTKQGDYRIIPEVITAAQAFAKGERGWWRDKLYESVIANNVYTPAAYPAGWKEVTT